MHKYRGHITVNATSKENRGLYYLNLSAIDECGRALNLMFTVIINKKPEAKSLDFPV